MKRKMQIIESKEMILSALLRLMQVKPIDEITMSELSHEAELTRMTLYRHFKTKEDVLLYAFDKNIDKLLENINQNRITTLYDIILFRFKLLKESPYSVILAENNYIKKLFSIVRKKTLNNFKGASQILSDEFTLDFIGGGIDHVTEKWLLNGMKTPYDEMANRIFDIMTKLTK